MDETHKESLEILTELKGFVSSSKSELRESHAKLNQLEERLSDLAIEVSQERHLTDYVEALGLAKEYINDISLQKGQSIVVVKILAVSSSFSWDFIKNHLLKILEADPELTIHLEWLLVEPKHLKDARAGLNSIKVPWHEISSKRELEIAEAVSSLSKGVSERFTCKLKYYSNIPHWHGVLINDVQLYLGRTSWTTVDDELHLRVGENEYRIFGSESTSRGLPRVRLFNSWFNYYLREGRTAFTHP